MKEDVLHYIWKYALFDKHSLHTNQEEILEIIHPGIHNHNSGPDFLEAKIRIGETTWAGNVEIHVNSSAWLQHNHQYDPAYNNVILHVVWTEDVPVTLPNGHALPSLSLENLVQKNLLNSINTFINSNKNLPCDGHLNSLPGHILLNGMERALSERLQRKTGDFESILFSTRGDWEESFYRVLCNAMGMKVNSEAFSTLAGLLPYNLLRRYRDKLPDIQALLYGCAGLISNEFTGKATNNLNGKFLHLKKKHNLQQMAAQQWRLSRTRPGNFPHRRIIQLAFLIHKYERFFSTFSHVGSREQLEAMLTEGLSGTGFPEEFPGTPGRASESLTRNIIINAVAPALCAYSRITGHTGYRDRAIYLLETTTPEANKITRLWQKAGVKCHSAFESQAVLELHDNYCIHKKCLSCNIGSALLK